MCGECAAFDAEHRRARPNSGECQRCDDEGMVDRNMGPDAGGYSFMDVPMPCPDCGGTKRLDSGGTTEVEDRIYDLFDALDDAGVLDQGGIKPACRALRSAMDSGGTPSERVVFGQIEVGYDSQIRWVGPHDHPPAPGRFDVSYTTPSHAGSGGTEDAERDEMIAAIKAFTDLPDNWDSYGATAPEPHTIATALKVLARLNPLPERVSPYSGGIIMHLGDGFELWVDDDEHDESQASVRSVGEPPSGERGVI